MAEKRKGGNTVAIVTELATPLIEENGLFLWDVEFEKEGASWYLRVLIDKEGGISYDDCEKVSRPLDKLLDEVDPIEQAYYLEVGSPGIDRELKKPMHFEYCMGEEVTVKLIRPMETVGNEREFTGKLIGFEDNTIELQTTKETYKFKQADCAKIRLYVDL